MGSKNRKNSPVMSDLKLHNDQTINTGNTDEKTIYTSFIRLQQHLALKTYYLKEHVLTPVMENFLNSRSKSELVRLYRAYCYFFNQELSFREFSAFLAHVIIDGFLRAGIFYSLTHPHPGSFSCCWVFKYAQFNRMPERRLALFKYLSSGSGEEQLPSAVQWMLDDISDLLWNFEFKQTCFPWKNPRLIDGELLQWEGYFFKPYYENEEEYKRVCKLLKKEGIFSHEVK